MNSSLMGSAHDPKRSRWTDDERRYLAKHRGDGREALSEALHRTPKSIRQMGYRLGFFVPLRPHGASRCPICGLWRMEPGTASYRAGMCPVCWERHKTEVIRQRTAEERAHREYETAKKRQQRGGR